MNNNGAIKPIVFGKKQFNPLLVAGIIIIILMIAASLYFKVGALSVAGDDDSFELEIFRNIGLGLKVESSKEAASSIGSVAQKLEQTRGSISKINEELGKEE